MPPKPAKLPPVLFHWTSSQLLTRIRRHGLIPHKGGFLGFHAHEAAVCLAVEGDCKDAFNPAVVLSDTPMRVMVEVNRLKPRLLAPDLNALLDPSIVYIARRQGVNLLDPKTWTLENSLELAGSARYLSRITPEGLHLETVQPPERVVWKDGYIYRWSDDERSDLRATIDQLVDVGRRQRVDADELETALLGLKLWTDSGNTGHRKLERSPR